MDITHWEAIRIGCRKVQIVTVSSSTPSQHFSSINIVPVSTSRGRLHDEGFIVRGGIPRESGHDTHTTEQSQAVLGRMEPSRVTSILLFEWDGGHSDIGCM